MSEMGQKRRFGDVRVPSALPLKSDVLRKRRDVSEVPLTDIEERRPPLAKPLGAQKEVRAEQ
jgi:hypothetical protein